MMLMPHTTTTLSPDELLIGEILVSLKRQSDVPPAATTIPPPPAYRSKVELSVQMPPEPSFEMFSTISPVASSVYANPALMPPTQSPSGERSKRYGPSVQLEDLRQCFNMPIAAVARKFGICATLLKKICRRHGIQRWPHRQIRSLQKSIDMLRESLTVAKGSNKDYIAKKIAAFEYTLECIMKDPNTAAKGISAGRLASPASEELSKRANRAKAAAAAAVAAAAANTPSVANMTATVASEDEEEDEEVDRVMVTPKPLLNNQESKGSMSIQSILC